MKTHYKPLSRSFPAYHPRAGQPTHFVEKLWTSLADNTDLVMDGVDFSNIDFDFHLYYNGKGKHHTISAGNKVKVGDFIQFYCWIGKPYGKGSTVVNIAPSIEIKKVWRFELRGSLFFINDSPHDNSEPLLFTISENDGLTGEDLRYWLKWPKSTGDMQIICWNSKIEY